MESVPRFLRVKMNETTVYCCTISYMKLSRYGLLDGQVEMKIRYLALVNPDQNRVVYITCKTSQS